MQIAIVTSEFISENNFHGGLANYTYKLAKWLIKKGHFVKVYTYQYRSELYKTDIEYFYEDINVSSVVVDDMSWKLSYHLNRLRLGFLIKNKIKHWLHFYSISYYINKKIKKDSINLKFDIIQYAHLSALALCRPKKIPSVVRISSSTSMCRIMGGYGEDYKKTIVQEKAEYLAMKKVNAVFGPSKNIAIETEKYIHKKIEVIETPYMEPMSALDDTIYMQFLNKKKYILFFGSVGLIKGVGTIAEVIYEILDFDKELYYVFVGKKLDNKINGIPIWDYLISKAGKYADRVIYFDSLKHDSLFPIIKHAELVTLPSRADNFPNTCIESMANEKIVIGTYGNGFEQLIEDTKNGFLITVDDHKKLLEKIHIVLALSPDVKQKIELEAKKRIADLDPSIVLAELVNFYTKIIKNKI